MWSIGVVTYDRRNIGLGKRWAGCKVRIVPAGRLIHVYYGKILLRSVTFTPDVGAAGSEEGGGPQELAAVREVPGTRCQGSLRNAHSGTQRDSTEPAATYNIAANRPFASSDRKAGVAPKIAISRGLANWPRRPRCLRRRPGSTTPARSRR